MNGQQKALENVNRFKDWANSMSQDELKQIVHRGQLNRSEVAKACGFAKSVLRQNPEVKSCLSEFEDYLREKGVLPIKSVVTPDAAETELYDQNIVKSATSSKRASTLEIEVIALRAENEQLRTQLRRYKELGEVMTDIGMMPQ